MLSDIANGPLVSQIVIKGGMAEDLLNEVIIKCIQTTVLKSARNY
jgi:hypothetical protein